MTGVFALSGPMPVKSALIPADFFQMPCVLASILTPSEMLIAICIVAQERTVRLATSSATDRLLGLAHRE